MKKMYVLASSQRNYSTPYVQAAHALSQFALEQPEKFQEWGNHTLVFLQCDNIEHEYIKLQRKGILCVPFHEPDYDNKLTALCTFDTKCMSKYKLL